MRDPLCRLLFVAASTSMRDVRHIAQESRGAPTRSFAANVFERPTKTSKLLAAKRPYLVPIRDSVVEHLLGAGKAWWAPMRELAKDERVRTLVDHVSAEVVPDNVSYLRRLDVVLWTHGSANRTSKRNGVPR